MRILYFSRRYTTHDFRFLSRLSTSPYEVYYLCLEEDSGQYETRPLPWNVIPVEWEDGYRPACTPDDWFHLLPSFEKIVRQVHPDLIHAGPVQSCGFMTAVIGFHPFLLMSWGSDLLIDADRNIQWQWLTRYAISHSDMLVCDSTSVRFKAQSLVPYSDEQIVQIPWGIDLQTFQSGNRDLAIRQRLGWENQRVILSTRSWEELYGIDILLEAFRQAYQADSNLRLLMLTSGSEREKILGFIAQHNLTDVVQCPGLIPNLDLVKYYQAADAYVSCAHSDGTSISLLEALGVGLPVVVTDIPSNREWVTPDENGWLGIDNDPNSFALAMLRSVHLSDTERIGIYERNRALIKARANWGQNIEELLAAYARLLTH